jgi:hypothetical protein
MSETVNNRKNQTKRGLSANQENIRPKLTKEQRAEMTVDDKREYAKERLKEYRREYNRIYENQIVGGDDEKRTLKTVRSVNYRKTQKDKMEELKAFYEKYKDTTPV